MPIHQPFNRRMKSRKKSTTRSPTSLRAILESDVNRIRAVVVLLLAAMALANGTACGTRETRHAISTAELLEKQGDSRSPATQELAWRHAMGLLSPAETERAIRQAVQCHLLGRSRLSVGQPWYFNLQTRCELPGGDWDQYGQVEVFIDGRPFGKSDMWVDPIVAIPAEMLRPGVHDIKVVVDRRVVGWGKTTPVQMTVTQRVVVEDIPAEEIVHGVNDDVTRRQIMAAITVEIKPPHYDGDSHTIMFMNKGDLPVGIAGRLEWRPSDGGTAWSDFVTRAAGRPYDEGDIIGLAPRLPEGSKFVEQPRGRGMSRRLGEEISSIDVRLIPSLDAVFLHPDIIDRYFSAPLIWERLPVPHRPKRLASQPFDSRLEIPLETADLNLRDAISRHVRFRYPDALPEDLDRLAHEIEEAFHIQQPRLVMKYDQVDVGNHPFDAEFEFEGIRPQISITTIEPGAKNASTFDYRLKVERPFGSPHVYQGVHSDRYVWRSQLAIILDVEQRHSDNDFRAVSHGRWPLVYLMTKPLKTNEVPHVASLPE